MADEAAWRTVGRMKIRRWLNTLPALVTSAVRPLVCRSIVHRCRAVLNFIFYGLGGQLMREIMNYDAEFRKDDAIGTGRSHARH
jgi:hypothetical protein